MTSNSTRTHKAILSFADVIHAVAEESGQDKQVLLGERRYRAVAYPRQLIMLIAHRRCPWASTTQVGLWLGQRDHSTVCHGIRAAKKRLKEDVDFRRLHDCVQHRLDDLCGQVGYSVEKEEAPVSEDRPGASKASGKRFNNVTLQHNDCVVNGSSPVNRFPAAKNGQGIQSAGTGGDFQPATSAAKSG